LTARKPETGPFRRSPGACVWRGGSRQTRSSKAVVGKPTAGIKDCAGITCAGSPPTGGIPTPVPHLAVASWPRPNREPVCRDSPRGRPHGLGSRGIARPRCPQGRRGRPNPAVRAGADVDCGPLADGQHSYETFGGKPRPVTASGRERPWASSSLTPHIAARRGLTARASLRWKGALGTQWGQMDGCRNRAPSPVVGACPPAAGRPNRRPFH